MIGWLCARALGWVRDKAVAYHQAEAAAATAEVERLRKRLANAEMELGEVARDRSIQERLIEALRGREN